jgi:hypothetical protein
MAHLIIVASRQYYSLKIKLLFLNEVKQMCKEKQQPRKRDIKAKEKFSGFASQLSRKLRLLAANIYSRI